MKTAEKLFNDSETFQLERPKKLTEIQKETIYEKLAEEIIENGWSSDDIDSIIEYLKDLSVYDSGYEMAKQLEIWSKNASYDIDTDFIYWLDDFEHEFRMKLTENVKDWVKAHNPKPKFEKGQKLLIDNTLNRLQKSGSVVYVTGIDMTRACYYIDEDINKNGGVVIPFEDIERDCSPC